MKHIIFVEDMKCEKCVTKIEEALKSNHIQADVSLDRKMVVVDGSGSDGAQARRVLVDEGFTIL